MFTMIQALGLPETLKREFVPFAVAIAGLPGVKTILPGEIEDIYPKPVKKGPA
jgi:hypothetical protein